MTNVRIGNDHAIEGYYDEESDDPEIVRYREMSGERTTSLMMPDGLSLSEMTATVIVTMESHMRSGAVPAWIDSDNASLTTSLCLHWGINHQTQSKPAEWGSNLGPVEKKKPARVRSTTTKKSAADQKPVPETADEENI